MIYYMVGTNVSQFTSVLDLVRKLIGMAIRIKPHNVYARPISKEYIHRFHTPSFLVDDPWRPFSFEKIEGNALNFREAFSPKKHRAAPDPQFNPQPYTQVFEEKQGFIPNLSILDLLFNEGPNSLNVLENSVRQA